MPESLVPFTGKRRVFFTMVMHPTKGWTRVGNAYGSRRSATFWLPFAQGGRSYLPAYVAQCTLHFVDGALTARSKRVLDQKFNLDPPEVLHA